VAVTSLACLRGFCLAGCAGILSTRLKPTYDPPDAIYIELHRESQEARKAGRSIPDVGIVLIDPVMLVDPNIRVGWVVPHVRSCLVHARSAIQARERPTHADFKRLEQDDGPGAPGKPADYTPQGVALAGRCACIGAGILAGARRRMDAAQTLATAGSCACRVYRASS
jgi:hypothetical protein